MVRGKRFEKGVAAHHEEPMHRADRREEASDGGASLTAEHVAYDRREEANDGDASS